jgi:hypothetical protein
MMAAPQELGLTPPWGEVEEKVNRVDPKNSITTHQRHKNRDADMDVKEKAERRRLRGPPSKRTRSTCLLLRTWLTTRSSVQDIRREQDECWDVYNEVEPKFYKEKDEWPSRVIMPKPFSAVQFAGSVVRKAFEVQFLSVTNKRSKDGEKLWQELLPNQLGRHRGKFPIRFTDAAMSFAIGTDGDDTAIPGGPHYSLWSRKPQTRRLEPDLERDVWVHQSG